MTSFTSGPKRIAIVGCGPCGLTAVKQFLDEGHKVTCFDPNPEVGGIWYVDPKNKDRHAAYEGGHLTIDNKLMCFSDDQPEGPGEIWKFQRYQEYLVSYSRKFNLRKHIKLQHKVVKARKAGAGWDVTARNVATDAEITEHFDMLVISTGSNESNKLPAELEGFTGDIVFSGHYVNNKPFAGKKVLLVGNGESSSDITKEISDVTSEFHWSMRNYPIVFPRVPNAHHSTNAMTTRCYYMRVKKQPADEVMPGYSDSYLLKIIFFFLAVLAFVYEVLFYRLWGRKPTPAGHAPGRKLNPFGQECGKYIDLNTPASKEAKSLIDTWAYLGGNLGTQPPAALMKNAVFIPNVLNGKIKVNAAGMSKAEGRSVIFKDGQRVDNIDTAVVCIGFKTEFPFLSKDDFEFCGDFRKLWKNSVHPKDPTIAFCGFARPRSGGVPVCAEMTARCLALAYGGKVSLPKDLDAAAEKDRRYQDYALHHMPCLRTLIASQVAFMDGMAVIVGCQVDQWKLLFTDPVLLWRTYCYSFNPAQYRLFGPHSNYDYARNANLEMDRGFDYLGVLLMSIDTLTPFYFPRLLAWRKYLNANINVEKWSFGGKPRYPEEVLKIKTLEE
eukprot:TRINITY_DN534_c0_g1_i10.p1 TRINITY_DN534_c0_g1~~TRINITY_DN534_c0_g1_i10.p1  ORF type:complete len:609 (-),score=115.43 TRINITY_DN534_c0_g1_i10:36-1862(-)